MTSCSSVQPNSIEAVNNKAWILHSYLERSREALEIVQSLQKRVNAGVLPCEFYDTLGTIQESNGQITGAEQSYLDGLKKSPEHPMLNFHFGKMMASDRTRAQKALPHLKKAVEKGERSNPQMAQEAIKLVQRLESNGRIQLAIEAERHEGQRPTARGVLIHAVERGGGIATEILFGKGRFLGIFTEVALPLPTAALAARALDCLASVAAAHVWWVPWCVASCSQRSWQMTIEPGDEIPSIAAGSGSNSSVWWPSG